MAGMRYKFAEPVHVGGCFGVHGLVERSFDEGTVSLPDPVVLPEVPADDDEAAVARYEAAVAAGAERDATAAALEHVAELGFAERIEDLPGLSGLRKADLLKVAAAEHIDLPAEASTNDEIRAVIEAARAGGDS